MSLNGLAAANVVPKWRSAAAECSSYGGGKGAKFKSERPISVYTSQEAIYWVVAKLYIRRSSIQCADYKLQLIFTAFIVAFIQFRSKNFDWGGCSDSAVRVPNQYFDFYCLVVMKAKHKQRMSSFQNAHME